MNNRKLHAIKSKKLIPNLFLCANELEDYVQPMFESLPPALDNITSLHENCLKGIYPDNDELEKLSLHVEMD